MRWRAATLLGTAVVTCGAHASATLSRAVNVGIPPVLPPDVYDGKILHHTDSFAPLTDDASFDQSVEAAEHEWGHVSGTNSNELATEQCSPLAVFPDPALEIRDYTSSPSYQTMLFSTALAQLAMLSGQATIPPALLYSFGSGVAVINALGSDSYAHSGTNSYTVFNVAIVTTIYPNMPATISLPGVYTLNNTGLALTDNATITVQYGTAVFTVTPQASSFMYGDGSLLLNTGSVVTCVSSSKQVTVAADGALLYARLAQLYLPLGSPFGSGSLTMFETYFWTCSGSYGLSGASRAVFDSGAIMRFNTNAASSITDTAATIMTLSSSQSLYIGTGGSMSVPVFGTFTYSAVPLQIGMTTTFPLNLTNGTITLGQSNVVVYNSSPLISFQTLSASLITIEQTGALTIPPSQTANYRLSTGNISLSSILGGGTWYPIGAFYAPGQVSFSNGSIFITAINGVFLTKAASIYLYGSFSIRNSNKTYSFTVPDSLAATATSISGQYVLPAGTSASYQTNTLVLNAGGTTNTAGDVILNQGTVLDMDVGSNMVITTPANCTWYGVVGIIKFPAGVAISISIDGGQTIATSYISPVTVYISRSGYITNSNTGEYLGFISPNGKVILPPQPLTSFTLGQFIITVPQTQQTYSTPSSTTIHLYGMSETVSVVATGSGVYTLTDVAISSTSSSLNGTIQIGNTSAVLDTTTGLITITAGVAVYITTALGIFYKMVPAGTTSWVIDNSILMGAGTWLASVQSVAPVTLGPGGYMPAGQNFVNLFATQLIYSGTLTSITTAQWVGNGTFAISGQTSVSFGATIVSFSTSNAIVDTSGSMALVSSNLVYQGSGGSIVLPDGTTHQFGPQPMLLGGAIGATLRFKSGNLATTTAYTITIGGILCFSTTNQTVINTMGQVVVGTASASVAITASTVSYTLTTNTSSITFLPDISTVSTGNLNYTIGSSVINISGSIFISNQANAVILGSVRSPNSGTQVVVTLPSSVSAQANSSMQVTFPANSVITYLSNSLTLNTGGSLLPNGSYVPNAGTIYSLVSTSDIGVKLDGVAQYFPMTDVVQYPLGSTVTTVNIASGTVLFNFPVNVTPQNLFRPGCLQTTAASPSPVAYIIQDGSFSTAFSTSPVTVSVSNVQVPLQNQYSYTIASTSMSISVSASGYIAAAFGGYIVYRPTFTNGNMSISSITGPFFVSLNGIATIPFSIGAFTVSQASVLLANISLSGGDGTLYPDLTVNFLAKAVVSPTTGIASQTVAGALSTLNSNVLLYPGYLMNTYTAILIQRATLQFNGLTFFSGITSLVTGSNALYSFNADGLNSSLFSTTLNLTGNIVASSNSSVVSLPGITPFVNYSATLSLPKPGTTAISATLNTNSTQLTMSAGAFSFTRVDGWMAMSGQFVSPTTTFDTNGSMSVPSGNISSGTLNTTQRQSAWNITNVTGAVVWYFNAPIQIANSATFTMATSSNASSSITGPFLTSSLNALIWITGNIYGYSSVTFEPSGVAVVLTNPNPSIVSCVVEYGADSISLLRGGYVTTATCPNSNTSSTGGTVSTANYVLAAGTQVLFTSGANSVNVSFTTTPSYSFTTCNYTVPAGTVITATSTSLPAPYVLTVQDDCAMNVSGVVNVSTMATMNLNISKAIGVRIAANTTWNSVLGQATLPPATTIQTVTLGSSPAIIDSFTVPSPGPNYILTAGGVLLNASTMLAVKYIAVDGVFNNIPTTSIAFKVLGTTVNLANNTTVSIPATTLNISSQGAGFAFAISTDGKASCSACNIATTNYGRTYTLAVPTSAVINPLTGAITQNSGTIQLAAGSTAYQFTSPSSPTTLYGDLSASLPSGTVAAWSTFNVTVGSNGALYSAAKPGVLLMQSQFYQSLLLVNVSVACLDTSGNIEFTGSNTINNGTGLSFTFVGTGSATTLSAQGQLTFPGAVSIISQSGSMNLPDGSVEPISPTYMSLATVSQSIGSFDASTNLLTVLPTAFSASNLQGASLEVTNGTATMTPVGQLSITNAASSPITVNINSISVTYNVTGIVTWGAIGWLASSTPGTVSESGGSLSYSAWAYTAALGNTFVNSQGVYTGCTPNLAYSMPTNSIGVLSGVDSSLLIVANTVVSHGSCSYTVSTDAYIKTTGLALPENSPFVFTYNGQAGLALLPLLSSIDFTTCGAIVSSDGPLQVTLGAISQQTTFNTGATMTTVGLVTANAGYTYMFTFTQGVYVQTAGTCVWQPDTGYITVPASQLVQSYNNGTLVSIFTFGFGITIQSNGHVLATVGGAILGYVNDAGQFVYALPAQLSTTSSAVSVPQIGLQYTIPALTLNANAASASALLAATTSGWSMADISLIYGSNSATYTGTYALTASGTALLTASTTPIAMAYGTVLYSVLVNGNACVRYSDGSTVLTSNNIRVLASIEAEVAKDTSVALITDVQSGNVLTVTIGAYIEPSMGAVQLFPGSMFGGDTIVQAGSITWQPQSNVLLLTGQCRVTFANGAASVFTDANAIMDVQGNVTLSANTLYSVDFFPARYMTLVAHSSATAQDLLSALDEQTLEAYTAFEAAEASQSVLLNAGGVALGTTGNVLLGDNTQIPLANNPSVYVQYPLGSTWLGANSSVIVPQGLTITTVNSATGAVIATYTAQTDVVVNVSGQIISASNGKQVAQIKTDGQIGDGPAPPPNPVIPSECKNTRLGLYVVVSRGGYSAAADACRALGLQPAVLDTASIGPATALLTSCGGPWKRVYIGGWGAPNTDASTCLALWNGPTYGGSGAVAVPASCALSVPILCRGRL